MKTRFKKSFVRDLKRIKDKELLTRVKAVIESVERASNLDEVQNLRPLRKERDYYRIRLGNFRLGLIIKKAVVTFVRILNRKDIYRYFP